jgi:hypothetical protein
MVWSVPASREHNFALQWVHSHSKPTNWKVCPHRQIYGLDESQVISDGIDLDNPTSNATIEYMIGVAYLPLIFENSEDFVRKEIIHYIVSKAHNINNLVQYVCKEWDSSIHRPAVKLWEALLEYRDGGWIQGCDMAKESNPIFQFLRLTEKEPKALELAEVFINYYLRQAKLEKDPHFLLPIRQCLQELTDPKKPYSETTLKLLRGLAYFPIPDRNNLVSHHWIAHSFRLRWRFWGPNPGGLDQYTDQVLHSTKEPAISSPKNSFARNIYMATFDMLWIKSAPRPSPKRRILQKIREKLDLAPASYNRGGTPEDNGTTNRGLPANAASHPSNNLSYMSFLKTLLYALIFSYLRVYGLDINETVKCYPFKLEALDNPAISALVKYKW